eukprot:scaffold41412_cov32-Attheya_sp.AAC.2
MRKILVLVPKVPNAPNFFVLAAEIRERTPFRLLHDEKYPVRTISCFTYKAMPVQAGHIHFRSTKWILFKSQSNFDADGGQ